MLRVSDFRFRGKGLRRWAWGPRPTNSDQRGELQAYLGRDILLLNRCKAHIIFTFGFVGGN